MIKTMQIMRITHHITCALAGLLALASVLTGCKQEPVEKLAQAVLPSEQLLNFEAVSAPEQVINVYSDGSWMADVDQEWITVTPMSGKGPMEVTVSVTDNLVGGVVNMPRKGQIIFRGASVERQGTLTVKQAGDTYMGVPELTVTQVIALDDEDVAKIVGATVAAVTTSGFVLTDGAANIYVQGAREVAVGDRVTVNGARATFKGVPSFLVDEVNVLSSGTMDYPEAPDMTDNIIAYDGKSVQFVKLRGSLVSGKISIFPATVQVVDAPESLGLAAVDLHKVVLTGYAVGLAGTTGYLVVTSFEDKGKDETLIPYPIKWRVRTDDINYTTESFASTGKIDPVQGLGYITYVPFDLASSDMNQKYALDVSDKSPRVTGPWPGDYWLFYGSGEIKAGSEVHIAFETRTSATGHKFWLLEFLDGEEWKPVSETFTTTEPGDEITYSHIMNADGATNVGIDYIVKYRKNTEHAQFRFRCMANWQASGAGKLAARNGGTARLSVTDKADETYQPKIEIIKEGNGIEKDPVYADIQVSTDLLTFNGTPGGPKNLTITSDHDFTISTNEEWLSLDAEGGLAGEETVIAVTCAESELPELREGRIKIVSEDTEVIVKVVQSAAGQMLDPFISISSGNLLEVNAQEGKSTIRIQSNTEFEYETDADWLTLESLTTRALVEWTDFTLTRTANEVEAPRTATVRFFNREQNIEAILTVTQEAAVIIHENNLIQWGFSAAMMGTYKDAFEKDNSFPANVAGVGYLSWHFEAEGNAADANKKRTQVVGGTGQPYITGAWPGDYWEFDVPLSYVAAGTQVNFKGLHRISGTGQKYWRMDWSADGTTWTPVKALQTETETGKSAQYTHIAPTSDVELDENFILPSSITDGHLKIRFTCVANWQGNGSGALAAPNGGTHRWSGAETNGPTITLSAPTSVTYFEDDFSWLQPYVEAWMAANPNVTHESFDPVGSNLASHTQPNIWNTATLVSTLGADFENRGYVDLNKSAKTLYFQECYFKMGATDKHTGLQLPAAEFGPAPVDAVISFDWCAHMTGAGNIDKVTIVVELVGPGVCEDSGASVSNEFSTTQEKGKLAWQHASVTLKGVTSETRIKIRPTHMSDGAGASQQRWHLDNIKIVSP